MQKEYCAFTCPDDAEECTDFEAMCQSEIDYTTIYSEYWIGDRNHEKLNIEMYQWTTLSGTGDIMLLYDVPFDDDGIAVNVCFYGL